MDIETKQEQLQSDKKKLFKMMKKLPHRPRTEIAEALGWLNARNQPHQSRLDRATRGLIEDDLVIKIGHRYLVKA